LLGQFSNFLGLGSLVKPVLRLDGGVAGSMHDTPYLSSFLTFQPVAGAAKFWLLLWVIFFSDA
jgi:hypothetical protein